MKLKKQNDSQNKQKFHEANIHIHINKYPQNYMNP